MYQRMIAEAAGCSADEARHVEAWMRLERGTLDGLDRATFRREARIGLACARASSPADNERLAESYGLRG
jgi:hypothetical protein